MNLRLATTGLILALATATTPHAAAADKTPPPGSLSEARVQMEKALNHAMNLLEMDTAAWAATDACAPVLQKMQSKLKRKADAGGYIQWKEGEAWRVLFFAREDGEYRALVSVLLETPLSRQSKGKVDEYPVGKGPVLEGQALAMARALLVAHERFAKETNIPPKPLFNAYLEPQSDGTFLVTYTPADQTEGVTLVGPSAEVTVGSGGTTAAGFRLINSVFDVLSTGAGAAPPGGWKIFWSEPLPSSADLLRLLLHPELGTVTGISPYGRFRAKAGAVPTFLPWMVPLGGPDPDKEGSSVAKSPTGEPATP